MSNIFNIFYTTALALSLPYLFPKFLINKRYRAGLTQRLGWIDRREGKNSCIWIHCASVGEVLAIKTLVKYLEKGLNEWDIVLSTNTNTGLSVAQKHFPERKVFYFPLDLSWIVDKVLNIIRPSCLIFIELELWPNVLITAAERNIPIVLLNARISEKSIKWYRILNKISKKFSESLAKKENVFCARTGTDATRLMNLGISEMQIITTGNMKFDNIVTAISEDTRTLLMQRFNIDKQDQVIVCGSTHKGEEAILLGIFQQMSKKFNTLRLILVPRHIERVHEIIKLIESMGLSFVKKTSLDKGSTVGKHTYETVILVDTVGELSAIYSIADCVFVGKSLVPEGGQNVMEPAGLAKPIIIGPHTFNFHEEVQLLREANALRIVHDESSLFDSMEYLLEHPDDARKMGKRAQSVVMDQRGATDRNWEVLRKILLKERAVSV